MGLADDRARQRITDRALGIMRGWLKLMVTEVNAEFPEWEFVQAFAVFNLSDEPAVLAQRQGATLRRHLCRIAQALKLEEPALHWEFTSHLEDVCAHFREHGGSFKKSWIHVCTKSNGNCPNTNLEKAILCWLTTSCSTSGVEQNFSKGAWGFNDRQLSCGMAHERATHRLLLYDGPIDVIIEGAQRVWKHCFGTSRLSGSDNREEREDKGSKRVLLRSGGRQVENPCFHPP